MPAPQEFTAPICLLKQRLVKAPYVTTFEPGLGWQPTQMRAGLLKLQRTWLLSTWLGRQTAELWPGVADSISLGWGLNIYKFPGGVDTTVPGPHFENQWTKHCFTPTHLSATEVDHDNESQLVEKDRNIVKRCLPALDPQHKTHLFWLRGLYRTCVF